jgi:selenocysteine lyase/cysteine desulfurase
VGDGLQVPCLDGTTRACVDLDAAASTRPLPAVADAVTELLPWYSSVHRGAGLRSRRATAMYEAARHAALRFCGAGRTDAVAVICRNTTEAINHLAFRLRLASDDIVLTTVVEHHANLLPWGRVATRRYVPCTADGTFGVEDVVAGLEATPRPKLLAVTGASNVTGWMPPLAAIIEAAHARAVPVLVDAAQLAPHRQMPADADYVAFSGHKMYAPFGAGVLVGPESTFADGEPFLAGGGAVDLVDLDEVWWTRPPEREEAGSPNVVGAVALHTAMDTLQALGWPAIVAHEQALAARLRRGLAAIDGVRLLGPGTDASTLAVASFTVHGMHHGLVASRLSAERGIAVRHGCFCAHPYLVRLLGLSAAQTGALREQVRRGDHRSVPGAVRASCSAGTSLHEVDTLLDAVTALAADAADGKTPPVPYHQDAATGDFWPESDAPGWGPQDDLSGSSCAMG